MKLTILNRLFTALVVCGLATAPLSLGCSGVEDEPIGVPTDDSEYELTPEQEARERQI